MISKMTGSLVEEVKMVDEDGVLVDGYRVNTPRGSLLLVPHSMSMVSHRWTDVDDATLSNLGDFTVVAVDGEVVS